MDKDFSNQDNQQNNKSQSPFTGKSVGTASNAIKAPSISLPKGGGAIKGMDEEFSVNESRGVLNFSIPIPLTPSRSFTPELALSYDSAGGNSPFGLGWNVGIPSIVRKTDKKLPMYKDEEDSDAYILAGGEELVPEFQREPNGEFSLSAEGDFVIREEDSSDNLYRIRFYKPRIENSFQRIERWTRKSDGLIQWRVLSAENITTLFGWDEFSRIADPQDNLRIYEWKPTISFDDKGNCHQYKYRVEDGMGAPDTLHMKNRYEGNETRFSNTYISQILYGNKTPFQGFGNSFPVESDYLFEVIFDYGEYESLAPFAKTQIWNYREDAFSFYNAGFEIRVARLCDRILLKHHFPELPEGNAVVKALKFNYDTTKQESFTFLESLEVIGFTKKEDGTYSQKSFPPYTFEYEDHDWNRTVEEISSENLENVPIGIDQSTYHFTDLYSEGLSGILSTNEGAWYYKRNLGNGDFGPATVVKEKPSFNTLGEQLTLSSLEADGVKYLVQLNHDPSGFFKFGKDGKWNEFTSFKSFPNIDFEAPNTLFLDLNGNGKPDILITEENVFSWHESKGEEGYEESRRIFGAFDEEKGAQLIFSGKTEKVYTADMSGDGLLDLVRVRNGEICYWPNLGYGFFGRKVAMDNSPLMDHPDSFNTDYLVLSDIDGSGTTDLLYFGKNKVSCWKNLSGNAYSPPFIIDHFPEMDQLVKVDVVDLMGTGLSSIVWSTKNNQDDRIVLRYINLTNNKKPHLLKGFKNNLGKETKVSYTPSTHYYIEDERNGNPWITRLHFPVYCVSAVEVLDKISGSRYITEYSYHHGYFDHHEKEFRGFGRVEVTDTEKFEHWSADGSSNVQEEEIHQDPVKTTNWYHTGVYLNKDTILKQYEQEYWYEVLQRKGVSLTSSEAQLPDAIVVSASELSPSIFSSFTNKQWMELYRSVRASKLRSELFIQDAPVSGATDEEITLELTPVSVNQNNFIIELIQPQGKNKYAVFCVKQSEEITYSYERDTDDPRVVHGVNLEIDRFGRILKKAVVAYPRKVTDTDLPIDTQEEQARLNLSITENTFTNAIDDTDTYRLPEMSESKVYEIKGLNKAGEIYTFEELSFDLSTATEVSYHELDVEPSFGIVQKRLLEHGRNLYYKNDLTGPLPLHTLESKAIVYENYLLAYTPELVSEIFGSKVNDATLSQAGFIHSEGDNNWWIRSGIPKLIEPTENASDALSRFYSPIAFELQNGSEALVTMDSNYFLFVERIEDALGNRQELLEFDYRLLKPKQVIDENDNISSIIYDELGLPKAIALQGKGSEADDLSGQTDYETSAEQTAVQQFLSASDTAQLEAEAADLLKSATVRFVYDVNQYLTSGGTKPSVVSTISREEHHSNNPNSLLQISFEYSNGLDEVIMTKVQAEPGEAKSVQVNGDNSYSVSVVDTAAMYPQELRWIGNGRIVQNNKGNTVKEYEPYFSVSPAFEAQKELVENGVSKIFFYDAMSRVKRIDYPHGTFERISHQTWKIVYEDQNDTILESEWYNNRFNRLIDAQLVAEGKDPIKEQSAASDSADHANTPTVEHLNVLGKQVLQVNHNRIFPGAIDTFYESRVSFDIEGNIRSIVDARGNTVMSFEYDMLGNQVFQNSMDSGRRWLLQNNRSKAFRTWDERNFEFQFEYDQLDRPTTKKAINGDGTSPLNHIYEKIVYGEGQIDDKAKNLRGQIALHYDTAGLFEYFSFDFKGNPLSTGRRLASDYKNVVNWDTATPEALLEPDNYIYQQSYDALGRIKEQITPDGSVIKPSYNRTGLFSAESLEQDDDGVLTSTECIKHIHYNAKGRRTQIRYGNNVTSDYTYDKEHFRLIRLESTRQNNDPLQDWNYTYDPSGNITHIEDRNVPLNFFNNQKLAAVATFRYDALYRLTEATGREHLTQASFGTGDNWNDSGFTKAYHAGSQMAWQDYTQQYSYDEVGNISRLEHSALGNNWTRNFNYDVSSNRLLSSSIGSTTFSVQHHAKHGFINGLSHLSVMEHNFRDELTAVAQQVVSSGTPETTYYQYDADGNRVRKITENASTSGNPSVKDQRVYIAGYEHYKKVSGSNAGLERHTVGLIDNDERFVLVETRNSVNDGTEKKLTRYQLGNHLGSASLELDQSGNVISYEEYHPFGTTAYQATNKDIKAAAKRYRYSGQERDHESGLIYYGARYYLPWLCRWSKTDPIGIEDGLNVYAFVHNNPIQFVDPDGMQADPSPLNYDNFDDYKAALDAARNSTTDIDTAVELWESAHQESDSISITDYEVVEEEYQETYYEQVEVEQASSAAMGAGVLLSGMGADVAVPEPTDVVPWKWIGYGVVALGAVTVIALSSTTTTTVSIPRTRTRTRRRRRKKKLVYITYTLHNPTTGEIYVGRSMGYGTPHQVMMARYAGHHKRLQGFGNPQLDRSAYATRSYSSRHSDPAYQAIRGREQMVMDAFGGPWSVTPRNTSPIVLTSGNNINGIGPTNVRRRTYMAASLTRWGRVNVGAIKTKHGIP